MARKRKDQLVAEYLENIHGDVLKDYPQVVREYVKGRHGVYALFKGERLYYVGLASNLSGRLKHHLKNRHAGRWDRFSIYITTDQEYMKDLESLFLRIAKPSGNKVKGKFARATLLNRRLRAAILRAKHEEVTVIFGDRARPDSTHRRDRGSKVARRGAPALAAYTDKRFEIRMDYKGRTINACVRSDGTINYAGEIYNSPSIAGARARGKRALNGWKAWKFKNSKGEWVYLDELRKGHV